MNLDDFFDRLGVPPRREWTSGSGDNNEDWYEEPPAKQKRKRSKLSLLWIALAAVFVLLVIVLPLTATFITDMYWYESLGFLSVFWRRLTARLELGVLALAISFAFYFFNWRKACKDSCGSLDQVGVYSASFIRKAAFFAALFFAFSSAAAASRAWSLFLMFRNPSEFGHVDPLYGIDVGFYVFSLPFWKFLQSWLQNLFFMSLAGSALIYFVTRSITVGAGGFSMSRGARLHLSANGALWLAVWGVGYFLKRYELLFSPTGVVFGAGYTDMHVILPALNVLAVASFIAAALLLVNFFKPMLKLSAVVVGVLFIGGFAMHSIVPGLVQQYRVKPNEYEMEKPYLAYHLECTKKGYGLDNVTTVKITPGDEVTAAEAKTDRDTIMNVRLWDYDPLLSTYQQLQAIRTYYNFHDIYIDRYDIDGRVRQVMLSVRELDLSQLQNPTWVNSHLEFTHGYGVVMNPVNEVAPGGLPSFFMKDLPAHSTVDIPLERPEIYYGMTDNPYALVNTDVMEFDYPQGDSNVRSSYSGTGGVRIGSFWRRLLFALRFRDSEIIFTGALNPDSRIMLYRNVRKALLKIAPFLIYDEDTYPVLYEGRIIWVQDSFTWSNRYPYSQPFYTGDRSLYPFLDVNYVRNSVKITVDAYNGDMRFYIVDDSDPMASTWRKIFPKLFLDVSEMPDGMAKHLRYPENLFEVQTEMYRTYHMTDTNTYYNREDVWEVTPAGQDSRIRPNYVTMKLWGRDEAEFAIIVPYMPLGRNNLIGWMAGRCDPENYGQLLVYEFPKQKLIYGPAQVEALINQNPEISAQLSLWSQRGSDVIRGDILVIPVGKSLLYVQPLYIKADSGGLPELKRVIVSTGGRVAWAETFDASLSLLLGEDTSHRPKADKSDSQGAEPSAAFSGLVKRAQTLYDSAQAALRRGDFAAYGADIKKLGEVLRQLEEVAK